MKRIIASRGTGKSTQLLRMAIENKAAIAVPSRTIMRGYTTIALEMGINKEDIQETDSCVVIKGVAVAPFPYFLDIRTLPFLARGRDLYIDEIEMCMRNILTPFSEFAGYTLSLEDHDLFKIGGKS